MWEKFATWWTRLLGTSKQPSLLSQIENILVAEIPKRVMIAKIPEPVYCMRIWYHGTDSPSNAVPYCMLIKNSFRHDFLSRKGVKEAASLWIADNWTSNEMKFDIEFSHQELNQLYRRWYGWLCEQKDERVGLQLFREAMQRVSKKLNAKNWERILPVTDDFVVFPADGSHSLYGDISDLLASAQPSQIDKLMTKGLLSASDLEN